MFKSTLELIIDRKTVRIYKCTICETVWSANEIPYGGLYGDVEWEDITEPRWHNHWYWKTAESDNSI